MKSNLPLTTLSLLLVLLGTLHLADDIVRGISPAGFDDMIPVAIFVVLLYGTIALAERRSGMVIMLVGGLGGLAMPLLHLRSAHIREHAASSGGFFFIWTLLALGTVGVVVTMLAAGALWNWRLRTISAPESESIRR